MSKKVLQAISQILIFLLALIAATVVIMLAQQINAWKVIISYWVTLTLKNGVDLWASLKE